MADLELAYREAESFFHRKDPVSKVLYVTAVSFVAIFNSSLAVGLALFLLTFFCAAFLTNIPLRTYWALGRVIMRPRDLHHPAHPRPRPGPWMAAAEDRVPQASGLRHAGDGPAARPDPGDGPRHPRLRRPQDPHVHAPAAVIDRRKIFARTFFLLSVIYLILQFTGNAGSMVWNWA